jgi:hypothetical protein
MPESSASRRKHRRVMRRRSGRDSRQELIDHLLSNTDEIPELGGGLPDRNRLYSFAIRQLAKLGALCPEFDIRIEALGLLVKEFGSSSGPPVVDGERRAAFVAIERILEARGIRAPRDAGLLEMEEVREGSLPSGGQDRGEEEEES